jgi:predicted RNA binding protein YcfA (HicA-like mRNA interferase family)
MARVTGSHHIFEHSDVPHIVNVQNRKGKAKAHQVRQFLKLVEEHNLEFGDEE